MLTNNSFEPVMRTTTVLLTVSDCLYGVFVCLHQVDERADPSGISFFAPPCLCCCIMKSHDSRTPYLPTYWCLTFNIYLKKKKKTTLRLEWFMSTSAEQSRASLQEWLKCAFIHTGISPKQHLVGKYLCCNFPAMYKLPCPSDSQERFVLCGLVNLQILRV